MTFYIITMPKKAGALAEAEANIFNSIIKTELEPDYNRLERLYRGPLGRSYPDVTGWYFLTFKPMDEPYVKDFEWFNSKAIRKYYDIFRPKSEIMWLTRETTSEKVHVNLLIYSKEDLTVYDEKILFHKVKVYSKNISCIDRFKVWHYIFKESKQRDFKYNLDYKYFDRLLNI